LYTHHRPTAVDNQRASTTSTASCSIRDHLTVTTMTTLFNPADLPHPVLGATNERSDDKLDGVKGHDEGFDDDGVDTSGAGSATTTTAPLSSVLAYVGETTTAAIKAGRRTEVPPPLVAFGHTYEYRRRPLDAAADAGTDTPLEVRCTTTADGDTPGGCGGFSH
jgi:hypothetical protein